LMKNIQKSQNPKAELYHRTIGIRRMKFRNICKILLSAKPIQRL
jgi:hypothetical protein